MKYRIAVLMLTLAGSLLCAHAQGQVQVQVQVMVIANASIAAGSISKTELRDVFTGASTSLKGGAQVIPVLLKDGPVEDDFLQRYVGKSDSAFRAGWRSLLFSGQGVMPRTLDSDSAVVDYVAQTPGAIGYIAKTAPHDGVKILVVR